MRKELHQNICDKNVFSSLYNKYSKDLHDFLYYKYGEQLNPNDKTQDAFIKLWENCKKVTLDTAKSFLFTVANNLMLNEIKHQNLILWDDVKMYQSGHFFGLISSTPPCGGYTE